ncbi:GNAT family N-acetyltransferase [Frigoribacterium sp. 2-23]|uniref:GNAT family N-acetyltransferase n=1 Tax=Frigoribacterium sp. 2-23 TaxID=3415006 RepID=UPI003C6F6E24
MSDFDDDYEIRTFPAAIDDPATDAWFAACTLGFHGGVATPETASGDARRAVADGRVLTGVYRREPQSDTVDADGWPVATYETFGKSLHVGGGAMLPAHLISGVTVQPTHRRRGILRRMITDDLARAAKSGSAVAALTASEGTIYRRFGFGPALRERHVTIDARRPVTLLGEPTGSVELVPVARLESIAHDVFARFHARTPGSIDRHAGAWNRTLGLAIGDEEKPDRTLRGVVHRASSGDGGVGDVDGYATYRVTETEKEAVLHVVDLVAATDDAYLGLWRLLLSIDLVTRVTWDAAPLDDPLVHALADNRVYDVRHEEDHVWFRLLDVPAALSARPYASDGVVTIAVSDDLGHATGTYRLTSEGGTGAVKRAAVRRADVELDVATLGALWLGGIDPVTLAAAGLVRERRVGAVQTLRALLRPERPVYGVTYF